MLLYFERQLRGVTIDFVVNFEGVVDLRQCFFIRKFHVHHGTNYLNYISFIHKTYLATKRHLRRGDFEQLRGNSSLTHLVVFQRQLLDKFLSVISGIFHSHHPGTVLRGPRIQNHLENQKLDVVRQYDAEQLFGFWFKNISEHRIEILLHLFRLFSFREIEGTDGQKSLQYRVLADRVDKMCKEHRNLVDLSPQKFLNTKF